MFEILEHTADIGFLARGATREEMFEEAAAALVSIVLDPGGIEPRIAYPIAAAGEDAESLLVNWLSEVLYYLDGQRVALARFRVERLAGRELSGRAWGEPRDPRKHPPRVIVKGVTYHQLRIREREGGFEARVFLDV